MYTRFYWRDRLAHNVHSCSKKTNFDFDLCEGSLIYALFNFNISPIKDTYLILDYRE